MVTTHLGSVGGRVSLTVIERREIGGFSEPDKMPWLCWSIPASACRTGGRLRDVEGSVCENCYAHEGRYRCTSTVVAMERRLDFLNDLDGWARAMAVAITRRFKGLQDKSRAFFRWHDSGDIQSVEHLAAIALVAESVPGVKFWLPTREYGTVAAWRAAGGKVPANLVIRLSAHMVDGETPRKYGLPVSSVHTDTASYPKAHHCPAYDTGGRCGDCRACWDPKVKHVSYPLH
jgi:hypothetical protein